MANTKLKSLFNKSNDADKEVDLDIQNSPIEEKNDDWLESEGQLTIDVYQTPQEIVIKSAVAGVKQEDLDISIVGDMITIKGKRDQEEMIKTDDYFYQECYWGRFSRSVILPTEVDPDRISATLRNGILTVRLPKIDKAKIKKIKVKSE